MYIATCYMILLVKENKRKGIFTVSKNGTAFERISSLGKEELHEIVEKIKIIATTSKKASWGYGELSCSTHM